MDLAKHRAAELVKGVNTLVSDWSNLDSLLGDLEGVLQLPLQS